MPFGSERLRTSGLVEAVSSRWSPRDTGAGAQRQGGLGGNASIWSHVLLTRKGSVSYLTLLTLHPLAPSKNKQRKEKKEIQLCNQTKQANCTLGKCPPKCRLTSVVSFLCVARGHRVMQDFPASWVFVLFCLGPLRSVLGPSILDGAGGVQTRRS